jgi:hypothetical protein
MNLDTYTRVVGSTAAEFAELELSIDQLFAWQILKMNQMYELPMNRFPTLDGLGETPVQRMQGFMKTLQKEMEEGKEVLAALVYREWLQKGVDVTQEGLLSGLMTKLEITDDSRAKKVIAFLQQYTVEAQLEELSRQILVQLADWLGDMSVFNRSEALKYGIPLEGVLACIMGSNFTKLDENGQPIKDENGKFLKGPNFLPPEDHIYATLFEADALQQEAYDLSMKVREQQAIAVPVLLNPLAAIVERIEEVAEAQAVDAEEDDEGEELEHDHEAEHAATAGDSVFGAE